MSTKKENNLVAEDEYQEIGVANSKQTCLLFPRNLVCSLFGDQT